MMISLNNFLDFAQVGGILMQDSGNSQSTFNVVLGFAMISQMLIG
jgi:hypothetical protein